MEISKKFNSADVKIEVRRLNDDEIPYITSLQKEATNLLTYYNLDEHSNWLARALKDIKDGNRVGFGVFLIDSGDKHTFVGSAIIKKATRNLHVEIKNLLISNLIDNDLLRLNVQKKLLFNIESFCAARGFTEMEFEFPADLTENLSFFLDNRYRVAFVLESRYRPGDYHYVLSKRLDKVYSGDPFDYLTISRWLVHEYFQFPTMVSEEGSKIIDDNGQEINRSFLFKVAPADSKSYPSIALNGACLFDSNTEDTDEYALDALDNAKYPLKLFVTAKKQIQYAFHHSNVEIISIEEIKKAFGINSSINTIKMYPNDVAGILIVVGSNFKERIINQLHDFYYVVGSGLGYALLDSELVEERQAIAAFCTEQIDNEGNSKLDIWGYSSIINFNKVALDSIELLKKDTIGEIWTKSELNYYLKDDFSANLNELRRISLLTLGSVNLLRQPIMSDDSSFISYTTRSYLESYAKYGISSCYLDKNSLVKILSADRYVRFENTLKQNNQIMIASIIAAISLVADVVTITGFSREQIKEWKLHLGKNSNQTETIIVSSKRLSGIIEATTKNLDRELDKYQDIINSPKYSQVEKDEFVIIIATRALKVLEAAEVFKDQIEDYDSIVKFLTKVGNARLG